MTAWSPPKIGREIVVRIPDKLRTDLNARAEREGITRSELIRQILRAALNQEGTR